MEVVSAAGIEASLAVRAQVAAVHVFADRQLIPAGSAENRSNIPFRAWPYLNVMIRQCFMAILAGIVNTAAGHPDRNDIERRVVVDAPGFRIHSCALDLQFCWFHLSIKAHFYRSTMRSGGSVALAGLESCAQGGARGRRRDSSA